MTPRAPARLGGIVELVRALVVAADRFTNAPDELIDTSVLAEAMAPR